MRVVVAGASGVIGTALVPVLRTAGHDVVRLVRRAAAAPDERGWDPVAGTIEDKAFEGSLEARLDSLIISRRYLLQYIKG